MGESFGQVRNGPARCPGSRVVLLDDGRTDTLSRRDYPALTSDVEVIVAGASDHAVFYQGSATSSTPPGRSFPHRHNST